MFDYLVCGMLRNQSGRLVSRNRLESIKAIEGVNLTCLGKSSIYPIGIWYNVDYYGHTFSVYVDKEGDNDIQV